MTMTDERNATRGSTWGLESEPDGRYAWKDKALCTQTDPDAFFPEKGGSTKEAKRICSLCEVTAECLQYALDNDERFGIFGGYSERERRRLQRGEPVRPREVRTAPIGHVQYCICFACTAARR